MDYIILDGRGGGTGAAPTVIRNNVGIPIELAIASIDARLRDEGIRNQVSLIAAGSIRNSADVIKIIALGADAVWLQEGVVHEEAAARGREAGLTVIQDRCLYKEWLRLMNG